MLPSPTICEHCPTMIGLSLNNKHFGGIIKKEKKYNDENSEIYIFGHRKEMSNEGFCKLT